MREKKYLEKKERENERVEEGEKKKKNIKKKELEVTLSPSGLRASPGASLIWRSGSESPRSDLRAPVETNAPWSHLKKKELVFFSIFQNNQKK